jgi:hypothetical protein
MSAGAIKQSLCVHMRQKASNRLCFHAAEDKGSLVFNAAEGKKDTLLTPGELRNCTKSHVLFSD